jgi:hypothetical protein
MKNKNRGKTERAVACAMVFVLLGASSCQQVNTQTFTKPTPIKAIVFEGTLEKLGPDPGFQSGVMAVYRLAKYRVDKVCEGEYQGNEIVIDQLMLTGKEFEGINVNDRVCVTVTISNTIGMRWNAEGIRSDSEDVKNFYQARYQTKLTAERPTCCGSQR